MKINQTFFRGSVSATLYMLHRAKTTHSLFHIRGGWWPLPAKSRKDTPVLISCPLCSKVFQTNWADYDSNNGVRCCYCPHCQSHLEMYIDNFKSAKPEPEFA